jgi:hypothetical protein
MTTARDNNRGTPRPEDIRRENDAFLRKLLAAVHAAVGQRGESGKFGEVTVKISQQAGRITGAKVLEETILKPDD